MEKTFVFPDTVCCENSGENPEDKEGMVMRNPWKRVVLFSVGLFLLAGPASAVFVVEVDPDSYMESASWSYVFTIYSDNYSDMFDHIEVHMDADTPPDYFEVPAHPSIDNFFYGTGWSQSAGSTSSLVIADGDSLVAQSFRLWFPHLTAAASTNMGFHIYVWDGGTQVARAHVGWLAPSISLPRGQWTIAPLAPSDMPPVPEPLSMVMLGGIGAGMLVARKLKRKKV